MTEVSFSINIEAQSGSIADQPRKEIPRILRAIADRIEAGRIRAELLDREGDEVGEWSLDLEDSEDAESDD